jgi:hypothetical protein
MREADSSINGTKLTDAESGTLRVSLATFMAAGIEAKDDGITAALTDRYVVALIGIQMLLDNRRERLQ